jgi:hypothetical protein
MGIGSPLPSDTKKGGKRRLAAPVFGVEEGQLLERDLTAARDGIELPDVADELDTLDHFPLVIHPRRWSVKPRRRRTRPALCRAWAAYKKRGKALQERAAIYAEAIRDLSTPAQSI